MKILVLIKQVPDTHDVRIDPKTGSLVREGAESIINPDDRHAIEAALSIIEKTGGKTTVMTMGPPQAVDALTEAMGMGIDDAVLLTDRAFSGADTWATSFTLGKAIEKAGAFDLVICGRQAIDGDTAQIGPQVAEYLGIHQMTYTCAIESVTDTQIIVKRRLEDTVERVSCDLPALLTVTSEANVPRPPNICRIISACGEKASIQIWNAADIGVKVDQVGLEGSMTRVIETRTPVFQRKGEMLDGDTKTVVDTLLEKLRTNHLIPSP